MMNIQELISKYNILYNFLMKLKISIQNENSFLELEDFKDIQENFIRTYKLSYDYYSNNDEEKIIPFIMSSIVLDMKESILDKNIKDFTEDIQEKILEKVEKYKEEFSENISDDVDIPYNILNFLYLFSFIEILNNYIKNNNEIVIENNEAEIEGFFNDILNEEYEDVYEYVSKMDILTESKIIGFGNSTIEDISEKFIRSSGYLIDLINMKRKNINSKLIYNINVLSFCIISISMLWLDIFSDN